MQIANNNMVGALRSVLIERGLDPRDFALLAFGGAGPLHAADLMNDAGIPSGVIPNYPGQFSAFGFILTDARVDVQRTVQMTSKRFDQARASEVMSALIETGIAELKAQGYVKNIEIYRSLEMRYLGQNYELEIPVAFDSFTDETTPKVWQAFHDMHLARFGFNIPREVIEVITVKATVVSLTEKPDLATIGKADGGPEPVATRSVVFDDGRHDTPIYDRAHAARRPRDHRPGGHRGARLGDRAAPRPTHEGGSVRQSSDRPHRRGVLIMTQKHDVDMVAMSIIDSTMTAVCREMGIVLMKTSYSTIFNEALDFTCALASPQGEMIAQAEYCPSMIGGVPLLVRSCVKEIPLETLEPGDVICHNDPYRGGLHCPEHTLIKPVFVDDELMGFAMTIGHLQEIGGMVPGAFAGEATEIFHEGIRVPPVKIKSRGEDVEEVWKLLLANVRTPRYNYGDLRALIAGVDVGERGLAKLIRKYGKEQFRRNVLDLMDYSESRMRAEIGAIEDGVYRFQDQVEDDGIESKPYDIKVAVHIQGDEVVIDYSGTSPQALGPINATLGVSYSAAYNGILQVTDETIPKNSGCFRPIRVVSPPGTLLNVDYPGPEVGGNTETHCKIAGAVIGALAPAIPDRTMAAEGATHTNFVFGGTDEESGEAFVCYAIELSGWGGRSFADGNDATDSINGNCRVVPVEVFETRFPFRTESYILVQDSGGAGLNRGGLSTQRTLKSLNTEIMGSQMSDRHRNRPWGLHGGQPGGLAGTWHQSANTTSWHMIDEAFGKASPSKWSNVRIRPGDSIRFQTPGGGGWGDPRSARASR